MTPALFDLLRKITDRENVRAFPSAIEIDPYGNLNGAEWMHAPAAELEKPENRPLCYTNERPTAPGWYWWRLNPDDNNPIVLHAQEFSGELWVGWPDESDSRVGDAGGQFAGPIPKPQEPLSLPFTATREGASKAAIEELRHRSLRPKADGDLS